MSDAGGADARLTADLVQKRRLVQELDVFQYSRKQGSLFLVIAILSPGAEMAEVERTIHAEISEIASGERPLTSRELEQSQNGQEMGFIWGLETPLEKAELLQSDLFYQGTTDFLEADMARYQEITSAQVQAVAAERLSQDLAARLVVEPEGTP